MQIENCGVPLIGTNCQKSALEQRVASLTRELEEARFAFGQIANADRATHPLPYALLVARRQLPALFDREGNRLSDPTETAGSAE